MLKLDSSISMCSLAAIILLHFNLFVDGLNNFTSCYGNY